MKMTMALIAAAGLLTLCSCGRSSAPTPEAPPPRTISSARAAPLPMTMRQLRSNREALAITRKLKGLPPVRMRLTSNSKSLRDSGIAPGIIFPGIDDREEK